MKSLSADALRQYRDAGYYAPVRAISPAEAASTRRHLESYEQHSGGLRGPLRHKTHLLFTWLNDLIRHPGILDPVEDVIGPNILCWGTSFFIKDGRDPGFVSWHQDSTYWGLEPPDIVTAWVAISESTLENGAMRVIPGSHRGDQMPHRDTFARDNLLSRGQEVAVEVDGASAVDLELQPGEMSLHHVRLIHGSEPNPSARAASVLPSAICRPTSARPSATATSRHWSVASTHTENFQPERRPEADMTESGPRLSRRVTGATDQVLMRETATGDVGPTKETVRHRSLGRHRAIVPRRHDQLPRPRGTVRGCAVPDQGADLSPSQLGVVFSAFFFGYAAFCFVGGYASDRLGARNVFGIASIVWSVFCGLTAAVFSFASLLVIRVIFGMGEGPTDRPPTSWSATGFRAASRPPRSAGRTPAHRWAAPWPARSSASSHCPGLAGVIRHDRRDRAVSGPLSGC